VAETLAARGYEVFLPQNVRTATGARPPASAIFGECVSGIDDSDLIVGLVDGPDVDSGTAWELGYAYARGKPAVVLRTDYRSAEEGPVNIMIEFSTSLVLVNRPGIGVSEAVEALLEAVDTVVWPGDRLKPRGE
jgi:nucleoside 2-deoxyribosyltransferase